MADLKAQFEQAVAESKSLPEKPDNMTLLKIYALFKQASTGDAQRHLPISLGRSSATLDGAHCQRNQVERNGSTNHPIDNPKGLHNPSSMKVYEQLRTERPKVAGKQGRPTTDTRV